MSREVEIREITAEDLTKLGLNPVFDFWGRVGVRNGAIVAYCFIAWETKERPPFLFLHFVSHRVRPWWIGIEFARFIEDMPTDHFVACKQDGQPTADRLFEYFKLRPTGEMSPWGELWEFRRDLWQCSRQSRQAAPDCSEAASEPSSD